MIRYGFDDNGFYSGQVQCQPNPMLPGAFLTPARTTDVAPPNPAVVKGTDTADKMAQWNGTSWDEADDPEIPLLLERQKAADAMKTLVFYRDEVGKDKMVLGHEIKSPSWDYDASEPIYNGKLLSDPANSGVSHIELDGFVPMSNDEHGLSDKEFDGVDSLITRTDAEYTNAVAAKVLEKRKMDDAGKSIVFYRTESGKDKKVLLITSKRSVWDYGAGEEPLYDGSAVSGNADVDYAELDVADNSLDDLGIVDQVVDDTDPNNKVLAARSGTDYDDERETSAWARIRAERDRKIGSWEWMRARHKDEQDLGRTPGVDTALTPPQYQTLLTYIQDLREVPNNIVDPIAFLASPSWPTEPSF